MSIPFRLLLPRRIHEEMIAQAMAELPNECCGLLAGLVQADVARVSHRYPLVNEKASPKLYLSEGKSLIAAHVDARKSGLDFLAVYHSHPTSPPIPSRTDLDSNYWPGVIHFIISLAGEPPETQAWWLGPNDYRSAEWRIEESGNG